jgi:cytochrome c oxidase subunit 4
MQHSAETTAGHGAHQLDYGHGGHGHGEHAHGTREYWMVFVILMVLLLATVGAAFINMGHFNVPVAFSIAVLKAGLILWFFMHLKQSTRLSHVFAFASFAWLALMLIITLGDYVSRNIMGRAEAETHIRQVDSYPIMSGQRQSQQMGDSDHGTEREGHSGKKTDAGH